MSEVLQTALSLLRSNQAAASEALCREALAVQPDRLDVLGILASALHSLARHGEAATIFEELTRRQPSEPLHWMNLGTARRGCRRYDSALAAYAQAAQLGCATADFYYNVGLTHLDRHDYESARSVLSRAAQLAPNDAEIRFQYARACYESLHTEEAVAALEGWQNFSGLGPELVANIGHKLMNLGESERAQAAVSPLLGATNLEPRASLTLVQILERTNRLIDARALLNRLIADPRAGELGADLDVTRAQLAQRASQHEEACALLRQAVEKRTDFESRHFDLFLLAQSLDALGRHDEAFETVLEAHRSQTTYIGLTAPVAAARGPLTMEITQYSCNPADIGTWDESAAPSALMSPVFIVAFPRSGTTLLELALDAHPLLKSMDEQPILQRAIDDMVACGIRYPERLGQLDETRLEAVRAHYWERVRSKIQLQPGQRLLDKNPLNMLRLPAIRRVFPNARIVLAIRHPCDVLLSCFMQHFRAPEFALLCSDLPRLASGYRRSFDFWYEQALLLLPAVCEMRYESLVADFRSQLHALSEFLELPWDEAMLAPANRAATRGYISTPSYSQVMQPVNTKSIGRWRAYEKHLTPILPQLQPYLQRWGYEV